jgi:hypothetical protein
MADDVEPNKLAPMKREEVIERAQRIFDLRGEPPYTAIPELSSDELAVLSEFVHYWRPFLVIKP